MSTEILPCAHCGGIRVESDYGFSAEDGTIECSDCGASVRYGGIKAWNHRPRGLQALQELSELLKELGPLQAVTGDSNQRLHPGSNLNLNSVDSWLVSEKLSQLKARALASKLSQALSALEGKDSE